jgi:hypothetical protein
MEAFKLLVNTPQGKQELIQVEGKEKNKAGVYRSGYFDLSRVLWDERDDGPFPAGMLPSIGGIVRLGNNLNVDPVKLQAAKDAEKAEKDAAKAKGDRKAARITNFKAKIKTAATLPELRALLEDLGAEVLGDDS